MMMHRFLTLALLASCSAACADESGSLLIKVLSFNIHGLPITPDNGQYTAIGQVLADRRRRGDAPDFVLLQEAFIPETDPVRELADYPHEAAGPARASRPLNSGLFILSQHPILETHTHAYVDCAVEDCIANKGLVAILVQPETLPDPLLMITTHMQADSEQEEVRVKQMDTAGSVLDELGVNGLTSIFAGDFNTKPERGSYGYWMETTPYTDAGRFCLDNSALCQVAVGEDGETNENDVWQDTVDRQFYHAPTAAPLKVTPVRLTRNFTEPFNGEDHYSDHWGYEVHYLVSWGQ